jgi:ABC-type Fe3+/spermidine/putrescine transport system ATPase subunit
LSVVIEQLSKHYGDVVALDRVDAVIERGSFTTLLGRSGSGKTTLLMCLAGFTPPSHGRVMVDGADLTGVVPERRNFGVVFQGYALFPHLTVAQNIGFPLRMRGAPRAAIRDATARMLALVQLEDYAARKPAELSGGQQQRVALARALSFDPALVLLDEPLSALDRELRESLRTELRRIHRSTGATFIMVTHDQEEALSLSDRVILLDGGRIVQQGAPQEIYHRPRSLFAARFVGQTNLFAVTLEHRTGDQAVCLAPDGSRFTVALDGAVPDGALRLSVRPEAMRLDGDGENGLPGTIAAVSFEGFDRLVEVDTALGRQLVRIRAHEGAALAVGTAVTVRWPPAMGHLIGVS